jgi:hypothetical protein
MENFVFENDIFKLVLTSSATAESLVLKSNGEECLSLTEKLPFFSITEQRPYNNEIKLAHLNKRTTFPANRLREENGRLIVGFELIDFEAVVEVKVEPRYMVFTLIDYIVKPDSFGVGVLPIDPPVDAFRLVELPISKRAHFGEWLNVAWDERVAVNVLATSPYARISSDEHKDHRVLFGETLSEVKLKGEGVALIVSKPEELLDAVDTLERDFGLPRGVESRRSPLINRSYFWSTEINPENVDEHIRYAKAGGFKLMSIYYSAIMKEQGGFVDCGQYETYKKEYKNGKADLEAMLEKIKAAGIIPGLHILHTHIGLHTKYLTPTADHRINITSRFTLARAVDKDSETLWVEENPEGSPTYEKLRVLRFMGELISYESYTTEPPYRFLGCKRGFNGTQRRDLEIGTIGGILDISEFCGNSAYVDQRTGLQDEIADNIANIYDAGFEFIYFDGSEGTQPPFDINVALAQWRVYRKLKRTPIFCEGAARSHFSWHMLSGGNAFDVWGPEVFKEMIAKHPFAEAPRMATDFTRINFGWWKLKQGQRPDIFEYGTSLAAAYGCPGSFSATLNDLKALPRSADILETLRRWELARSEGFITPTVADELKRTDIEHTLLINESGELELVRWEEVKGAAFGDGRVTVFLFEHSGKRCAALWHNEGRGILKVPNIKGEAAYISEASKNAVAYGREGDTLMIPVEEKRVLVTDMDMNSLKDAFMKAVIE